MTEGEEQRALFDWANLAQQKYPELKFMHHIPNGGRRDIKTAYVLKRQGVKAGVPDIFLPVARNNFHGLYIELKTDVGKTSKEQRIWIKGLTELGYKAVVCHGWVKARETIEEYLI
ncbi:MAG: VRR-NUC domain-containing protein [Fusobacterium necrophorum]|nr:VRR-NUC domain-containing protein [Fusobacterium necrophorum]